MTTPTEKEIAALVNLTEALLKGQFGPIGTDKIIEPFRAQKPRVGIMYEHADGVMTNPCKAVEYTDAVKLRLGPDGGVDLVAMEELIADCMNNRLMIGQAVEKAESIIAAPAVKLALDEAEIEYNG